MKRSRVFILAILWTVLCLALAIALCVSEFSYDAEGFGGSLVGAIKLKCVLVLGTVWALPIVIYILVYFVKRSRTKLQ